MIWLETQKFWIPLALAIVVVLSALITVIFNGKSEKIRLIPLKVISVTIIIAEIIKLINIYNINGFIPNWNLPFQFCSMFLVWFFMAAFFGGKVGKAGRSLSFVCGVMALIVFMIGPTSVIGNATDNLSLTFSNYANLHAFFYHFIIVLFPILVITLKLYKPKFSDWKLIAIPFYIYALASTIMANVYNENYIMILENTVLDFPNIIIEKVHYFAYLAFMYAFSAIFILLILYISSTIVRICVSRKRLKL